MSDAIIKVESLSKRYIIGHQRGKGDGLRHSIERAIRDPLGWLKAGREPLVDGLKEAFWALKDISFEVKRGEVVGVIGRNGAGKSTLLKLLSRITEPTAGRICIKGRVASLLEVGTGFHPELTGRENIFLNGAILGMRKMEIRRKLDEIVAFAEIEKFLDTPVKRYSSGMYVRLAFAVAAHLEPEILIVDEILAVGDSEFQKKCLGKLHDVASIQGRTILLVSHQMGLIQNLCNRCFLLDKGSILQEGNTDAVLNAYLSSTIQLTTSRISERKDRKGAGDIRVSSIRICDNNGNVLREAISGSEILVRVHFVTRKGIVLRNCKIILSILKEMQLFFVLATDLVEKKPLHLSGTGQLDFIVPDWPLSAGTYLITSYIESNGVMEDLVEDAARIDVMDGDFYGAGQFCHYGLQGRSVLIRHSWRLLQAVASKTPSDGLAHF
jgi:homopolymeric O-antigen transport system ATP-binding protein